MGFKVPERLYRTKDGRLVRRGDPEAATLAFVKGQELTDQQAKRAGLLDFFGKKNRAEAPQNKQAPRPADKTAVPDELEPAADPEPEPDASAAAEPAPETAAMEPEPAEPKPRAKPGPKPGMRRSRT